MLDLDYYRSIAADFRQCDMPATAQDFETLIEEVEKLQEELIKRIVDISVNKVMGE